MPDDFRYRVKGARQVTSPWHWNAQGGPRGDNGYFLSAAFAIDHVVAPLLESLGVKLGTALWRFPPQGPDGVVHPRRFAEALYRFLAQLPVGPR